MQTDDKIKVLFYFLAFYIFLFSSLFAAINQTVLIKVESGKEVLTELSSGEIHINPNNSLTLYFTVSNFDAQGAIQYRIFIDNQLVADSLRSNIYETELLPKGIHNLRIEAFSGIEYEAIPAELNIVVDKSVNVSKIDGGNFSILVVALIAALIFTIVIIFILWRKNKNSVTTASEPAEHEIDELKKKIFTYKSELDKKVSEVKHLHKVITRLNKNIEKLEEANVNLIEQKEALSAKKIQLEELQTKKDELLAIKFHDIKNPANAIHGLVELLESYDLTASEQQEIMESLVESSTTIVDLIQNISETFAKENFDDEYIMENSSLQDVVDSVVTINSAYAKKKGIRLINNSSNALPKFKFDPMKIKEVVDNLVNNAVKYSPSNTDVAIRTYMTEKKVYIEVSDNGVGISEKELPYIFEKGVKLSPKPTGNEKSSGLGMWIVKKVIEVHKGKIEVKSKLNAGTVFTIELPLNQTSQG